MITIAALLVANQAHAFCDEGILETDVLCVTEEAEEIKLCRTVHPMTEMEMLTLHVAPAISEGPLSEVARDIPFAMTLGTGGYPWDIYGLTFLHEGGRAVLNLRRAIDAVDNSQVEISLDLFGRGSPPQRTLTCMVPALRAEIEALLTARGIAPNDERTGPSADSRPFYIPRQPLPGDTPYGGYACREVGLIESNEGSDAGQIALYTAPFEDAAIMGYVSPYDASGAFECWNENGFSGIVWPDGDKRGDDLPWSTLDFDARLAACGLNEANWPPNVAYDGKCSSAWVTSGSVAGFGG
ncbi:hypothetical protein [Celeribacter sp.]|uniref:hypothetical protein n=1 Tax=Celeribacter sp. TaxID=1890673 RepID=UPI003A920786